MRDRKRNLRMMEAVVAYDLDLIKELVDDGYDIHCEDDFVFKISLDHNKPEITDYVISLVDEKNNKYYINEALVSYAHSGNIPFVEKMLEMDGNIHYKCNEAVNWACGFGKLEMVKYLIKQGAVLNEVEAFELALQNNHHHVLDYLSTINN